MSQSSNKRDEDRAVLFQRSGELSEFVDLLDNLGLSIDEQNGPLPTPKELAGACLAIVPGRLLIESNPPNLALWPPTVAVIDDSSKTLANHLNRLGVAMVIRRPVHPRTLRLLLLHQIYRGPERRANRRVLIGYPIRAGSGLFKSGATLLELSSTGARIELPTTPKIGSKLRVVLGKDLTHGKPLKLEGAVVRCIRPSAGKGRPQGEVGVRLLDPKRHAKAIRTILDRFAIGPASWQAPSLRNESSVRAAVASKPTREADADQNSANRHLPPVHESSEPTCATEEIASFPDETAAECEEPIVDVLAEATREAAETELKDDSTVPSAVQTEASESESIVSAQASHAHDDAAGAGHEEDDDSDRRRDPRSPYDQRVVALGKEAARVLVGRDLSRGGLRIETTDSVGLGDMLRIALHSGTQSDPLIVVATAVRGEGDEGTVLTFEELSPTQLDQLDEIIAGSTETMTCLATDLEEEARPVVLGEMLETLAHGVVSRSGPSSEREIADHLDSIFDAGESI